jgi:demethylmenaquinone methyltransferase/2-methoxy-6-polyprenyl-1,4-benzoquinol methylase
MLSGAAQYRYLQESIAAFPSPEAFAELMQRCGLRVLHLHILTFGVCALYVAEPSR